MNYKERTSIIYDLKGYAWFKMVKSYLNRHTGCKRTGMIKTSSFQNNIVLGKEKSNKRENDMPFGLSRRIQTKIGKF